MQTLANSHYLSSYILSSLVKQDIVCMLLFKSSFVFIWAVNASDVTLTRNASNAVQPKIPQTKTILICTITLTSINVPTFILSSLAVRRSICLQQNACRKIKERFSVLQSFSCFSSSSVINSHAYLLCNQSRHAFRSVCI